MAVTRIPKLVALTPESQRSLTQDSIEIIIFPFKVGRESRIDVVAGSARLLERRKSDHAAINDLYLLDTANPLNVSREHFQIEKLNDQRYELLDRSSACGTIVGNETVGGKDKGGRLQLEDGNVIIVGTSSSPFVFKFLLEEKSDS